MLIDSPKRQDIGLWLGPPANLPHTAYSFITQEQRRYTEVDSGVFRWMRVVQDFVPLSAVRREQAYMGISSITALWTFIMFQTQ